MTQNILRLRACEAQTFVGVESDTVGPDSFQYSKGIVKHDYMIYVKPSSESMCPQITGYQFKSGGHDNDSWGGLLLIGWLLFPFIYIYVGNFSVGHAFTTCSIS